MNDIDESDEEKLQREIEEMFEKFLIDDGLLVEEEEEEELKSDEEDGEDDDFGTFDPFGFVYPDDMDLEYPAKKDVDYESQKCDHIKKLVTISHTLKYYICTKCKKDLGDA